MISFDLEINGCGKFSGFLLSKLVNSINNVRLLRLVIKIRQLNFPIKILNYLPIIY